jgi:hypothetical protein
MFVRSQCLGKLYPMLRASPHSVEMLPSFLAVAENLACGHWQWFIASHASLNAAERGRAFRAEDRAVWFTQLVTAVVHTVGLEEAPPELASQPLAILQRLQSVHSLYATEVFERAIRQPLLDALFALLTSGRNGFMRDEVIAVVYEVAKAVDYHAFVSVVIPSCVRQYTNLQDANAIAMLVGCFETSANREPPSLMSFAGSVDRFLNDLTLLSKHADKAR